MSLIALTTGMLVALIVTACYILVISFTLWMAIDAGKQDRFWWLTLILGLPVIGPAVYYFTEKKHEYAKVPRHHVHDSETDEQHEATPKKKKSRKKKEETVVEETKEEQEDTIFTDAPQEEVKLEEAKIETEAQVEENKSS
jgi:hypothetical protein